MADPTPISDLIFVKSGNNYVALPENTSYSARWNDLDSDETGRSAGTGVLNRERIRSEVWEIDIACSMISDPELITVRSLFAPAEITVKFWVGEWIEAQMYGAQGSVECVANPNGVPSWNFSISLTEL